MKRASSFEVGVHGCNILVPPACRAAVQSAVQRVALSFISGKLWLGTRSPLSPLLYVAAAQFLAAHLRQEARLGHITPISPSRGSPVPPCHQHADDTSLDLRTRANVSTALQGSIQLFCAASASQVNPHKSRVSFWGLVTASWYSLLGEGHFCLASRHSPQHRAFTRCSGNIHSYLASVRSTAKHWASRQLTQLERVHVASNC